MTHTAHELEIQQWLADLAIRCEPRSRENLTVLIADYARGLADLPYGVWTEPCRNAAAEEWERFPSYKALRKFLRGWAERHTEPPRLALPAGVSIDATLGAEDRALVEQWWRLRPTRMKDGTMSRALDLLRQHDRAFRAVCDSDAEARRIALYREWLREAVEPIDVSEGGIARNLVQLERLMDDGRIGGALASMGLSLLHKAVAARAPERLPLLPETIKPLPERQRSVDDQLATIRDDAAAATFEAKTGRKPGQLSPEDLAETRRRAGYRLPDTKQAAAPVPANDHEGGTTWPDWMDPPPMAAE